MNYVLHAKFSHESLVEKQSTISFQPKKKASKPKKKFGDSDSDGSDDEFKIEDFSDDDEKPKPTRETRKKEPKVFVPYIHLPAKPSMLFSKFHTYFDSISYFFCSNTIQAIHQTKESVWLAYVPLL